MWLMQLAEREAGYGLGQPTDAAHQMETALEEA